MHSINCMIFSSVRIPAALQGLYGLRPSFNRIPYEGSVNSLQGADAYPSVLGPISISLSGVKAFTKAIVGLKPWTKDPLAVRKPWDEDAYELKEHGDGKDLCFALIWDNGDIVPHPPIRRALESTKAALEAKGIKCTLSSHIPCTFSAETIFCYHQALTGQDLTTAICVTHWYVLSCCVETSLLTFTPRFQGVDLGGRLRGGLQSHNGKDRGAHPPYDGS